MKKILFIIPSLQTGGGVVSSLRNLLPIIKDDNTQIFIYPINQGGNISHEITQYAKIISPYGKVIDTNHVVSNSGNASKVAKVVKVCKRCISMIGIDLSPIIFKRVARRLDQLEFDCVIGFQEGQATLLAQYFNAPTKVAWMHSICSRYLNEFASKANVQSYYNFNKIVCVSQTAAHDAVKCFPALANRITVVYNAINTPLVKSLANEVEAIDDNRFHIVSVGRIDPVKRFSHIPKIASELKAKGVKFCWDIVGGIAVESEHKLIVENIAKYNVSDCVNLLGHKTNPYPYIKSADLLVCLSSSETFNYTLAEARTLHTPVLTTDFPSAVEFVENGKNGYIAPIEDIPSMLDHIITAPTYLEQILPATIDYCYDNQAIKTQFTSLLN
jgi:glycosyltransferase involved in cell wall biosynthesis